MKMSQGRYAAFVCLLLLPLHLAYAAMNVLVADRIDQLRVNLERGRWTLHEAYDQFLVAATSPASSPRPFVDDCWRQMAGFNLQMPVA